VLSISFLIASLSGSGGTQRVLSFLANNLVNHYEVFILVNQPGESFYKLDSRIHILELPKGIIRKNFYLYRFFKKSNVRFYINLDSNSVILNGFLLPFNTKLIIWEHFSIKNNYKKILFKLSRRYAAIRAHAFVLLSKNEEKDWNLKIGLSKSKIKVINNPISFSKENIDTSNKFKFKRVLAIGNNAYVKGFDLLIESWKKLNSNWELIIVGLPENQIVELSDNFKLLNESNFKLIGKTENIQKYYETSSIFVLSSRIEAAPLVLIESQSFGLPAILFDHLPGALDLINDSALISNFSDPIVSLKNNIEKLINDEGLYSKLHKNALENSKRFDQEKFINKWLELLNNA